MSNYNKLWQNLGLDLKRHDELLEVLGSVYENIFLSQEKRPDNMKYFDFVVSEAHGLRIQELAEHKEKGGKVVATFCVFVPEEVTLAADAINVGLCAGSQFWIGDGEKVLPRNLCPLIKAGMGAKVSKTCPYYESADLVVGETTCDGKKKCWEILNEYIPTYVMDVPQMKRDSDIEHFGDEIKTYIKKIEEITGNKITPEKLAEKIELINEKRRILQGIHEKRKAPDVPISGKDALLITQLSFYDDPERFIEKGKALIQELDKRISKGESVYSKGTPRIMIAGTPQALPNWKLHDIIETGGGVVVCEESCIGTRYYENTVYNSGEELNDLNDLVKALAERYMKINCSCFTPNNERVEDIARLAKEYNVDGIVYYNLQFCHGYNVEYNRVKKALDEAGIPVIMIESDYSDNDYEQIRTRVEAFIEMLK